MVPYCGPAVKSSSQEKGSLKISPLPFVSDLQKPRSGFTSL